MRIRYALTFDAESDVVWRHTPDRLARRASPALLAQARGLGVPVVAIGGIGAENGGSLLQAGADLLAVLGAVFDHDDPPSAARAFLPLFATNPAQ